MGGPAVKLERMAASNESNADLAAAFYMDSAWASPSPALKPTRSRLMTDYPRDKLQLERITKTRSSTWTKWCILHGTFKPSERAFLCESEVMTSQPCDMMLEQYVMRSPAIAVEPVAL